MLKVSITFFALCILILSCSQNKEAPAKMKDPSAHQDLLNKPGDEGRLIGSWKMVYADVREADSVQVKDLSNTDFIKIINASHFAFFNQERESGENFMGGAGSYTFNGRDYVETLDFIGYKEYRGHTFHFTVEFHGDTLVQKGREKIEEAGIDRYILEKYIPIHSN